MEQSVEIIRVSQHGDIIDKAATWFSSKWSVPRKAYVDSMTESLTVKIAFPEWYVVIDANGSIIAGCGVIENDFHEAKHLSPNVCALFVEEPFRKKGIAGALLETVCADFSHRGIDTLYLVTEHTTFYERYGWDFLCYVKEENSTHITRMYVYKTNVLP